MFPLGTLRFIIGERHCRGQSEWDEGLVRDISGGQEMRFRLAKNANASQISRECSLNIGFSPPYPTIKPK